MTCWMEESNTSPFIPVQANRKDTRALLYSGSLVALVRPKFVQLQNLMSTVRVTCIQWETWKYPTTLLRL